VIDAEFGMEDYSSIPHNCIERGFEPLDVRTDSETKLNWW
jgi:hypothetical protein